MTQNRGPTGLSDERRSGDQAVVGVEFEQYVVERRRALLRFAVVLTGDESVADDLVAQVLAVAFERWSRVGAAEHVHAYVRRMIVNEFLDRRARSAVGGGARQARAAALASTPSADPHDPSTWFDATAVLPGR